MKKLLALALAILMVFALTACNKGDSGTTTGNDTPPAGNNSPSNPAEPSTSAPGTQTSEAPPAGTPQAPPEGAPVGGTIAIPITDDPTTMLGWMMRNQNEQLIGPIIYEYLLMYDATGKPQPYLLESATEDVAALTYTLVLRDGITFQDGTPLDAEALKWNLDYYQENGVLTTSYFMMVENVEVKDGKTVVVHMSSWDSQFLYALARTCYMCSPTAVESMGVEAFNEKPVGTGPFMVSEWKHGEGIYTVRYDNYWQGKPLLDGINIIKYATTATQQAAMLSGDLDVMYLSGDPITADALAARGFNIVNSIIPQTAYTICFNSLADTPLKDVRVRQAICYAIDAQGICSALLGDGGYGEPSTQWALPGSTQYMDIPGYGFDLAKAKDLMDEAGYGGGFDLTINYQTGDFPRDACQVIEQQLAQLNISLKLNEIPVADYGNYLGEWDGLLFHPMGASNGQFSQIAANMIPGARFGSGTFLHDEESVGLIAQAITSDDATATANLKQVVKILFQDNVELYTVAITSGTAVINPKLMNSGLNEVLGYAGNLWTAYLAE